MYMYNPKPSFMTVNMIVFYIVSIANIVYVNKLLCYH